MEAGASQEKPSSGRGKTVLAVVAIAVVLAVAIVLVFRQLNKDHSSTANASSVVLIAEEPSEEGHCQGPLQRPSEIKLGCGKLPLTGLHWSSWGAAASTAQGVAHVNNCRPDCASGTLREFPITVALSRIKKCPTTGEDRYLSLNIIYLKGKHPDFSQNYRCPETSAQKKSDANAQLIAELAIKAKGGSVDPELLFVNRSARDPEWVQVSGETKTEPPYSWTVDLKSDNGKWIVRYAGFEVENEAGETHHYVAGLPCDLDFSQGSAAC